MSDIHPFDDPERLRLLLDDRYQPVPHDLGLDALKRAGLTAHDDCSTFLRSSII